MILDNLLALSGANPASGISNTDGTDSPTTGTQTSATIVDIGIGLQTTTNPSGLAIPGVAAGAGARDLGVGDKPSLKLLVETVAYTSGGTTIQVQFTGAPDNGSGAPGTFTVYASSFAIPVANASVIGAQLFDIDIPRPPPGVALPRYWQLQYVSTGTFVGLKVKAFVILDRFDQPGSQSGILSGYVPGITIPN